jgi:hypothetical protein
VFLRSAEHEAAHYAVFPLHSPHRKFETPQPTFLSNVRENLIFPNILILLFLDKNREMKYSGPNILNDIRI